MVKLLVEKYGADAKGSLFQPSDDASKCSLRDMTSALLRAKQNDPECIFKADGLSGYLYFGRRNTMFPMHTEDGDLWSVNYLHSGAPKVRYVVAREKAT